MANGTPSGTARERALAATGKAKSKDGLAGLEVPAFDADARAQLRADAVITIGERPFKRVKKTLEVSRELRKLIREQETNMAKATRTAARIGELEAEQLEAAADGKDELEAELEAKIGELVKGVDEAREVSEVVSFRIIALLLDEQAQTGDDAPELLASDEEAVDHLVGELDVNDAVVIANMLANGIDPNPQTTQATDGTGN